MKAYLNFIKDPANYEVEYDGEPSEILRERMKVQGYEKFWLKALKEVANLEDDIRRAK